MNRLRRFRHITDRVRVRLSPMAFWSIQGVLALVLITDLAGPVSLGAWLGGAAWAAFFAMFVVAPVPSSRAFARRSPV